MVLTYPVFCQELQAKKNEHRSGTVRYEYFAEDEGDFWVVDKHYLEGTFPWYWTMFCITKVQIVKSEIKPKMIR